MAQFEHLSLGEAIVVQVEIFHPRQMTHAIHGREAAVGGIKLGDARPQLCRPSKI